MENPDEQAIREAFAEAPSDEDLARDAARWRAFAATAVELEEHTGKAAGIWYSGPMVTPADFANRDNRPTVDEYGDILVRLRHVGRL